jgi:hypothetical protein
VKAPASGEGPSRKAKWPPRLSGSQSRLGSYEVVRPVRPHIKNGSTYRIVPESFGSRALVIFPFSAAMMTKRLNLVVSLLVGFCTPTSSAPDRRS